MYLIRVIISKMQSLNVRQICRTRSKSKAPTYHFGKITCFVHKHLFDETTLSFLYKSSLTNRSFDETTNIHSLHYNPNCLIIYFFLKRPLLSFFVNCNIGWRNNLNCLIQYWSLLN